MKAGLTPKYVSIFALLFLLAGLFYQPTHETTALLTTLLTTGWLAIVLHELGHVLFGKLSRFNFGFFIVGPLRIENTVSGVKWKENLSWPFFGGVAMMLPPQQIKPEVLKKNWALFTAGGPTLSLVTAGASFLSHRWTSLDFFMLAAIMNASLFLATIIPSKIGLKSDGLVLLTLLSKSEKSQQLLEDLLVSKELLSQKPPSEWNQEYIRRAKEKDASIENLQYALLLYYFEIARNGFPSAVNAMARYQAIPINKKNQFSLGFLIHMQQLTCFFESEGGTSVEKIVGLQQSLSKLEPVSFYRGKVIIAHLQNDAAAAALYLQKVYQIIDENEALYGFFKAEKTLTRLVEEKIHAKAQSLV
ncbi:hypothetical protein [Neobacillus niacini]|uniref:hypothetical protein n=1 Tax=Neobacillus niacini TaxID=86668 RepID=UPI0021CB6C6C|nr:hypothetical protein [Neobacillus niacini]MCM3764046.1 hypothetical protein [Neobacillus niacini]